MDGLVTSRPSVAARPLAAAMASLRDELSAVLPLLGPAREVAYLDIPYHPNTGDRLIHAGTEEFFRAHRVRVVHRCTVDDYDEARLRARLGPQTVIALHGGGNFGTIWPRHHGFREMILQAWPDRAIVVLPQSIEFADAATLEASAKIFRAHPRVAICVRDRHSEAVGRQFSDTVLRVPDMAHALWGSLVESGRPTRPEPLVLGRTDKESTGALAAAVDRGARATDWLTWLDPRDVAVRRWLRRGFRLADRLAGVPLVPDPSRLVRLDGDYLIRKAVRLFSEHPQIVTDRLHGLLLACLLQRPVRYLDNSYGKLGRYIDCWLGGVAGIEKLRN